MPMKSLGTWRCPGCGLLLERRTLHVALPTHLRDQPECNRAIAAAGAYRRVGLVYVLPATLHVAGIVVNRRNQAAVLGMNPEGRLCPVAQARNGRWSGADAKAALDRLLVGLMRPLDPLAETGEGAGGIDC